LKKKAAFVCVHNSYRSQMAEGWAKKLGDHVLEAYSAGTEAYPEIKPLAVQVMREVDIDLNSQYPKLLTELPEEIHILITMGCGVACPFVPCKYQEDWGIADTSYGSLEEARHTRDLIKEKVQFLIERIEKGEL
jgi:arsenate reductase (thioredoxin)